MIVRQMVLREWGGGGGMIFKRDLLAVMVKAKGDGFQQDQYFILTNSYALQPDWLLCRMINHHQIDE